MSGKPIKKKSEQVGQAAPAEVNAPEAPVITPAVTGHYQPVTQPSAPPQSDSAAPELTGSDTIVTLNVSGTQLDTEQLNQDQVTLSAVLTREDADKPAGVEVLLVQAVSPNGFYRAGQFWPHEGVHAFVCDDPDSDNAESAANIVAPFISAVTAERLKAEPNLRVTVVETVVTDAEGE
ncbi:hypothetical protein [Serratia grimesii]|uniref:hypothetical protein n=1 Tax=Serratia grimesii TaxID=82995 RepID=UPI00223F6F0B|nr:hypothetical protein [Serratia grimesii]